MADDEVAARDPESGAAPILACLQDLTRQRWRGPFVGGNEQNPFTVDAVKRGLSLPAVVVKWTRDHACARILSNSTRVVLAARVPHHDLVSPPLQRADAVRNVFRFILGEDYCC